jgi:hypothetical protein
MKNYCYAFVALFLFFAVQESVAQEHGIGLGVIIGEPTGIDAKLWTSDYAAFDFGLGWSIGGDRIDKYNGYYNGGSRVHIHIDYLGHSFEFIHSTGRFPLYYGIGGHINIGAGYNSALAMRCVIGVAWLLREAPIDIFLEFVPSFQLTSPSGIGFDAGIGARYFF